MNIKNTIDLDILRLPAFCKKAAKQRNSIYFTFGNVIDNCFSGDIEKFKRTFKYFRQCSAKANKTRDLNEQEIEHYSKLKKFFRSKFALGRCTFSLRIKGKVVKAPFATIAYVLKKNAGIRIIKHGKCLTSNEHWQNFFLPVYDEIDKIYDFYKRNREKLEMEIKK